MPIPKNIKREHVLSAISEIDNHGVPEERNSTKFNLLYEGRHYPPKYVLTLANKYANGHELIPSEFSGGKESNSYLSDLGFEIKSNEREHEHGSHSWTIISPIVAVKEMDKSSFLHKGTGIPMDIRYFFEIENMEKGEKRRTTLIYSDTQYEANFIMDKIDNPRTRLLWAGDFAKAIRDDFPVEYEGFKEGTLTKSKLKMKFTKYSDNEFEVHIASEIIENSAVPGEFDYIQFNRSFSKKEYVKGKLETKYYILTVKNPENLTPPHQNIIYRVIVLENHQVIKKDYVYDRNHKNLLTPAKDMGIRFLLEYAPAVSIDDITMVHYKQDRPNADAWQNEKTKVLEDLFNKGKGIQNKQLETVSNDIESERAEEDEYYQDGAVRYYYGKRYERNPINRQRAIEIHGLTCMACGFNFEEVYGEHGKDFIEVHHVKQLSTLKEEMDINPAEDLVTLCSNCHRMVHRQKDNVLSLDQLKEIIMW
ncbi:HNH endonuclease [Neobacillus ginsengisoli]|uniref:5-methylcytosine-specific restriction protein A n=1 Tax=Neobacillus ginsengisoli TaxID=904295 RepID=A0ABT9Y1M8_9BACI|nr:HNH endonuclease [Neobacillus ginsengisoli]MDQ0201072.1 5-methylcytosine-specific restriction protein A [Neobacillus ginsengisoli]